MLADPKVRALLTSADERYGTSNPLDSITKLNIIRRKVPERCLHEVLSLLLDYYKGGAITAEQFGTRNLDGKLSGSGGKGILDIMVFKIDIKVHMTSVLMNKYTWPDDVKTVTALVLKLKLQKHKRGPDALLWRLAPGSP